MRTHPLAAGRSPDWATAWGEDAFGPFVAFEVGGIEHRMRWIPPGRFVRGSPDDEAGRYDDERQQTVVLTEGFWLGETPVTQDLWEAVMGENPSRFRSPTRPVEQVSWEDCQGFCARLRDAVVGLGPRLPTEAEWEHACRAGTSTATYTGDLEFLGENNAPLLDDIAWYGGNSGVDFDLEDGHDSEGWREKQYAHTRAGTHLVRQKQPNSWGLYDLLGNVWEWCEDADEFDSQKKLYTAYALTEQLDPVRTEGSERVIRGGSWSDNARHVRAAFRYANEPGYRNDYLGFRLAGGRAPGGRSPQEEARDEPTRP